MEPIYLFGSTIGLLWFLTIYFNIILIKRRSPRFFDSRNYFVFFLKFSDYNKFWLEMFRPSFKQDFLLRLFRLFFWFIIIAFVVGGFMIADLL